MPIYDYRCDHCGHVFSAVRSFSDADVETCPSCGKRPRKLITAPAVVFKGSGWYKTDSRGKAPKEEGGSSPAAPVGGTSPAKSKESDSASKGDQVGEAKPAPKEPTTPAKETGTTPKSAGDGTSSEARS